MISPRYNKAGLLQLSCLYALSLFQRGEDLRLGREDRVIVPLLGQKLLERMVVGLFGLAGPGRLPAGGIGSVIACSYCSRHFLTHSAAQAASASERAGSGGGWS
jgi:hypothetical protein